MPVSRLTWVSVRLSSAFTGPTSIDRMVRSMKEKV